MGELGSIKYRNKRTLSPSGTDYLKEAMEFTLLSAENRERMRMVIRKNRKRKLQDLLIKWSLLSLITLTCSYYLYQIVRPAESLPITQSEIMEMTERDNKFLFFITDGDNWLKKEKWHNAIFQYKKALEIYPGDYEALYRLTLAYSYRCQNTAVDCDLGEKHLDELLNFQSGDSRLIALTEIYKK